MGKFEKFEKSLNFGVASKSEISSMLGKIRGGSNEGNTATSSSYTSGTNDCDGTSICKFCPRTIPPVKK